jgi:hypothetical protein
MPWLRHTNPKINLVDNLINYIKRFGLIYIMSDFSDNETQAEIHFNSIKRISKLDGIFGHHNLRFRSTCVYRNVKNNISITSLKEH